MSIHDYQLTSIDGAPMPLSELSGKVVLLVNVASACGLTPHYKGLQALYEEFADQGLVVVGIPCNQFAAQEPGTEAEIKQFCETQYNVTFPLASKIEVNGDSRDPLYTFLSGDNAKFPGDIVWNFEKFLVGRDGEVIERFHPKTEPEDEAFRTAIENALAA